MFGGKNGAGVYQAIVNLMPPHDTYIEAFLGSGAVMRMKAPARLSMAIDLDKKMIDEFRWTSPVTLLRTDAVSWLRQFTPVDRALIYCDPPYVHSTRTGHDRYRFELTNSQHEGLCTVLRHLGKRGAMIMLSGYRNGIYKRMLAEWETCDFQAMTRGGVRTETIWMNFTPGEMHYHTFAGNTFGERQRIKRKAARWATNYQRLPPGERQAILAAMLADPE